MEKIKQLRELYAEVSRELARQTLLEEAHRRAWDRVRLQHRRIMDGLAPHARHPEVAEAYLEEAEETAR